MSTLSGVTQKGEKGKKFQSLDINSLYNHANKGESSEPHLQRNTAVRRHGMQTLGKVTTPRRPPANLPSLKAEHSGSDPSVSLVPSGGTGWGTKPGETGPSPNSQPTPQPPSTTTPASSTPQPLGPNAPAAAGIGMPAPPPSIAPPTPAPQPPVVKTIIGSTTSSGDKTWSSVTCGDAGPSFLAHQSPQFQQEFPSLSGEGAAQGHPGSGGGGMKGGGGPDVQYGPGPPLRPQTEGSWISGGGTARSAGSGAGGAVPPGAALLNPAISQHPPPYHPPHHPQELGSSSRSNLGPFGPGVGQGGLGSSMGGGNSISGGGPPPSQSAAANMTVPSQFRNVIPNFLRKASGFSTIMPPTSAAQSSNSTNSSTFQNNSRPSRFNNQPDSSRNVPSSRHADPSEDLAPRPIIREEDLTRMDEISRDGGWAAQNDIDYNQKIAFSDDESTGVEDDKESLKEKTPALKEPEVRETVEKREVSDEEKQPERQVGNTGPASHVSSGDRLSNVQEQERDSMWAARGPGAGGPPIDFRQHPRQAHPMVESEDPWSRKRRQNSEKILQVTERANQRREEVEKKFEESRTRGIGSDSGSGGSKILKKSKDDEPYDIRMSGWDKEDNLGGGGGLSKNDGPYFRQQMPQLMDREGSRDFRDRDRDYNRPGFNTPPRFQKQMVAPPGREPQGGYEGNRWGPNRDPVRRHNMPTMGNQQHGHGGYMKNMQGQLLRGRPQLSDMADIPDNMTDRLVNKEVDDKGSRPINDDRDRYRHSSRNDGSHDLNRKNNYYDAQHDYNRLHHRDFDHSSRDKVKELDYRQRDTDEQEWEGRRGNSSSSWDTRHYDDKSQRKENRKPNNEPVYKSQSSSFSDDRDMDRPQKIDTRDRAERPQRPDSRDSRASRDSRNSRDSIRDENKSVPENNEFSWNLDLDKDTKDDKLRRRDLNLKDEKRDIRREGHVPGPITKEKMSAYENKLMKTEKREVISSSLINSVSEEDNRNSKLGNQLSQPSLISSSDGWLEGQDMAGSAASSLSKDNSLHSLPRMPSSDDMADKSGLLKDEMAYDKKKDSGGQLRDKDGKNARSRGERGPRSGGSDRQGNDRQGNDRQGNDRQGNRQGGQGFNSNSPNYFFQRNNGGPAPYSRENDRRRPHGKGGFKDKMAMSDSDGSLDEMSVSTESGKEDKKTDRRHGLRPSKSGERKKDKDERNHRETKKSDNDENFASRKHGGGSGGQGYDSVNRKEGFAPRGQPSRRGRGGGYRAAGRGSLGNVAGHYGPPGSKSPFPSSNSLGHHDNRSAEEDDKMNDRFDDGHHYSDMDKSKNKSQSQGNMTGGNRQPKESRKGDLSAKGKTGRPKGGSAGDDRDSTSEGGSDSDTKKQTRNMRKTDKNKSNQRAAGEKRAPYNASHVNGRPTHSDDSKDNSFQEVKGKKVGKEPRNSSRGRKDSKGKTGAPSGQPGNAVGAPVGQGGGSQKSNATSKPFHDKWPNKPPRLQKLDNVRKQQQMGQQSDVSEMNKINQSSAPMFSSAIRDVNCTMAPAPLPAKSAWDKPITAALKSQSPTNALHLSSSIVNSAEKTGIEIPDHVQSGTNSQTSSPSADKVMSTKLAREVVDKGLLDGATPPVQTIIFENKNYKYTMKPNQRIDKGRGKLDVDLDGATHGIAGLSFKTGVDLKTCDNKTQESLQMQMTFKNEDNADMKLDFFESDLSQLTEEKNIPRSIHLGQADLDEKIALVKKVWETASSPMEQHQVQHQLDDSGHVVPSSSSSSFPQSFGGGVESALDHGSGHQVDDNTFNNADGYGPSMQSAGSYSTGAGGMMKQDPNNPAGGVKPQPQQAAVMSSTIGAHSGQSLSSPPPVLNQPGHFGFQTQYSTMPTIPSPPAVIMNPQGGQVPTNTQEYVPQHGFPFSSHTMIGSQTARSSFSQPFNAFNLLNQSQTSYGQFIQTPPTGSAPPDMYSSVGPYRLPPSYGQTASNPSTVLISSTSNSLMSASVKTTPQQPPSIGPIGTKGGYVNSQIQMPYMSYEPPHNLIPTNYLQPSQLVQQRHGAGNVTPGMQPSNSFFSGSTGAPGGFSSMLGTNSQSIHSATAFSMQGFNNQTAATPGSAPPSSNVGHPQYSPMGHFRTASPYMKQGVPGQHQPEASKSPSNNQDALSNSVFSNSGGGGQIPSPKSRSSAGSNNGSGKQMSVSPQQPSPTQSHHKFPSYQQNLVQSQPPPNSQAGQQRSASQLTSVQQRSNNGTSGGASPLSNQQHIKYQTGPGPIQRPPPPYPQCGQYVTQQQPQRRVQQQHGPPPRMQQAHVKNYPFIQQGNQVKLESSMEGKSDQDKFMDGGSSSAKTEKKEEVTASADP